MPLVCVLWPAHEARAFLWWSDSARGMTRADDGNAARWLRATRKQVGYLINFGAFPRLEWKRLVL